MAEIPLYCLCGQPYDPDRFMIQCDYCNNWYHGSCVGVKEYQSVDIDKFFCCRCESESGPTMYKPRLNWHRHDQSDPDAEGKPIQAGTPAFIEKLKTRSFRNAEEVITRLRGQQLTLPYLHANGFSKPILVEGKDGLGLHVPQENFTVQDVENYVGSERVMDVIDVTRQSDIRMSLHDFVEYYTNSSRARVFNVISLEFSDSHLSALVEAPYIARKLCWVNNHWPRESPIPRPEVQKYCLMGVKDSYTDFHIDFGGSSVWYHVLKGEKVFYFVPPTPSNLQAYQRWMQGPGTHETFFGDLVDGSCYRQTIQQGQTLLIPTGWIHAVWTPRDSLVFGGNFLHSLNIALQLEVYEIEKATKAPERFRFPHFETLHWLAAQRIVQDLRDMNGQGVRCPEHLVNGARALLAALKNWSLDRENNKSRPAAIESIPEGIAVAKLLKDLNREVRNAERHGSCSTAPASMTSHAPSAQATGPAPSARSGVKNERETSKRVRRKPKARADFVDINEALSNFAAEEKRLAMKSGGKIKSEESSSSTGPGSLKILLPKKIRTGRVRGIGGSVDDDDDDDDDEDEEEKPLMIDERRSSTASTPKVQQPRPAAIPPKGSLKIRLSVSGRSEFQFAETTEVAANMDIESGASAENGIEHLLMASSLAAPVAAAAAAALEDIDESGRASPSTREAIVGMLSMSRGFASTDPATVVPSLALQDKSDSAPPPLPFVSQKQRKGRRRLHASLALTDESGEVISKVHQDDEYIYPSLDASDDEMFQEMRETGRRKSSGRSKRSAGGGGGAGADSGDESWNPRARVGPVAPKTDRPVREGVKRPAVERVLEAAAQKRAQEPPPKRPYHKRKKPKSENPVAETSASGAPTPQPVRPAAAAGAAASTLPKATPHPAAKLENKANLVKKPKKGMATAKQRLGKILKIHKMAY